jgi:hypothetical protein
MVSSNGRVALNVYRGPIEVYDGTRRSKVVRSPDWAPLCWNPGGTHFLAVSIEGAMAGKRLGIMDLRGRVKPVGTLRSDMVIDEAVWRGG